MRILSEIYFFWTELLLGITIIMLLGYGVIYTKKEDGDGEIVTLNKRITRISIGVLVLLLLEFYYLLDLLLKGISPLGI